MMPIPVGIISLTKQQAAAFTVSNMYYNQPILHVLAEDFNVSFEKASQVPTLMHGGYAAGVLFLCPLGDIFRRRPFVLFLIFTTANVVSDKIPEIIA